MGGKRYRIRISKGGKLEGFLSKLKSTGAMITFLTVIDGVTHFRTDQKGVKQVRKYRRRYGLKVTISATGKDAGLIAVFSGNKFLIAFAIPLICSFFLWSVVIESDSPEVAQRIEVKLEEASISPLRLLALIPKEDEIRRDLMQDDSSLSWVRFKRVGTSLVIIPMLSPTTDGQQKGTGPPSDLVARTGGVVTRFELSKGERVGHIYMTAKKGDVLATGTLEQGDRTVVVGAEGAVYADYWVEYSFSIPKMFHYKVQGEEKVAFTFHPPWKVEKESGMPFWQLFTTERLINEVDAQLELTEGMEEAVIVPLIKNQLLAEYGSDAVIKDDKVLHVTFENDKVSGTILFLVNDNIAVKKPIPKGD